MNVLIIILITFWFHQPHLELEALVVRTASPCAVLRHGVHGVRGPQLSSSVKPLRTLHTQPPPQENTADPPIPTKAAILLQV